MFNLIVTALTGLRPNQGQYILFLNLCTLQDNISTITCFIFSLCSADSAIMKISHHDQIAVVTGALNHCDNIFSVLKSICQT